MSAECDMHMEIAFASLCRRFFFFSPQNLNVYASESLSKYPFMSRNNDLENDDAIARQIRRKAIN